MDTGLPVARYQLIASLADSVVHWRLGLETDDGRRHEIALRDGEEVPILLDLLRGDKHVYFDERTRALRTGWNFPGERDQAAGGRRAGS
jgi:hypothetical protein